MTYYLTDYLNVLSENEHTKERARETNQKVVYFNANGRAIIKSLNAHTSSKNESDYMPFLMYTFHNVDELPYETTIKS